LLLICSVFFLCPLSYGQHKILTTWSFLEKKPYITWIKVEKPHHHLQTLVFEHKAEHKKPCGPLLRKFSRYEDYHLYFDFIKKSTYNEPQQHILFTLNHPLLPFPLLLTFRMARMNHLGTYPFIFSKGIFPGLSGSILIEESLSKRCRLSISANWSGPPSGIPNLAIELFGQTLVEMAIEKVLRLSLYP
jgi:hypothetical protein